MKNVLYYSSMQFAYVEEIFSSVQGEGPHIGRRHIFVRFLGCDIRCRYCDTPASHRLRGPCRVQKARGCFDAQDVPNPLSAKDITNLCARLVVPGPSRPWLSLTGGEPLLQKEFLLLWLPQVRPLFNIYLETNGIHHGAMKDVGALVDTVSMDFKLPSATGLRPYWDEHREFLSSCRGREIFVKAVVTKDTTDEDVATSAKIIAGTDGSVPLILQPASGPLAPPPEMLLAFQEAALEILPDVRVIPQAHKIMKVP